MKMVHLIADYGPGDLAFGEVIQALSHHLPNDFHWHVTSVSSFDTLATGFVIAQLGLLAEDKRCIIYANCAPRQDRHEARVDNEGEGLLYGVLDNETPLLVVNSGYSLSFVRDRLKELWSVKVERRGSQFRSRDLFPQIVGRVAKGELNFLKEQIDPKNYVPAVPKAVIGYIDSFGNLKTTFREGDLEVEDLMPGQKIKVSINGIEKAVTVAVGSFSVPDREIAFAPGSSGHDRRFWEIFERGGSASATFGFPKVGAPLRFEII